MFLLSPLPRPTQSLSLCIYKLELGVHVCVLLKAIDASNGWKETGTRRWAATGKKGLARFGTSAHIPLYVIVIAIQHSWYLNEAVLTPESTPAYKDVQS